MLTVKSKARKPTILHIPLATRQARLHVDRLMPGAGATVDSRQVYWADQGTQAIITTVTFPRDHAARRQLAAALADLPGADRPVLADSSIVLTRVVA